MTCIQRARHMYADTANYFRDPFVSNDDFDSHQRGGWLPFSQRLDFNRPLTPPPDMNGIPHTSKPGYYQQEHGYHYGDFTPGQQAYRAPAASYGPQEVSNADFGRNGVSTEPCSCSVSPTQPRQKTVDDSQQYSHQRRGSQANAIAPSFQIPKSVNDSGGSLSELAAQVRMTFLIT